MWSKLNSKGHTRGIRIVCYALRKHIGSQFGVRCSREQPGEVPASTVPVGSEEAARTEEGPPRTVALLGGRTIAHAQF